MPDRKGRVLAALLVVLMLLTAVACRGNPQGSMRLLIETDRSYARGDGFMSSDFTVTAILSDGTEREVSDACSFSIPDAYRITGDTEFEATYNGVSASYTIEPKGEVAGIMIASDPQRTVYDEENKRLDYTGLSVLVLTTSGNGVAIPYGDPRLSVDVEEGTEIIAPIVVTVSYMDTYSTKLAIQYGGEAERLLTGIIIAGYPKTEYKSGETLDLTGLSLLGQYDDGSVSALDAAAAVSSPAAGTELTEDTVVTITYSGLSTEYTVRVSGEAEAENIELMEKADYSGYLQYSELTASFDTKGLLARVIFSDGTAKVFGDEDMVYSTTPVEGKLAVYAEDAAVDKYRVHAIYGGIDKVLYTELYSVVDSMSIISGPTDIKLTSSEFQGGDGFKGEGLVLYVQYTGGRASEILTPETEGVTIDAVDNHDGTWTAYASYRGADINLGTYEFIPESMDVTMTIDDGLGAALTDVENGTNTVNMIGDGSFTVTLSADVSRYSAEWYVNGNPYEGVIAEGSSFLFTGLEKGGIFVITGIFTDGTTIGGGSVQFVVEITEKPYISG